MMAPAACRRTLLLGIGAIGTLAFAAGCGGGRDVILRTAAGEDATAEDIDREPLWLLPPGGVGWLHLEVAPTASSELGKFVLADLQARLPLPESAGFVFERDVVRLSLASYSMQGFDFAGVATGRFDVARIEAAASESVSSRVPLVKSSYAGRSLFTAASVGFVILTPRTALFGNETGIRRCLDRIAEARVADDLLPWVKELLVTPNAAFSGGADLQASPLTAALAGRLSALRGASTVRALGNFDPPGINLAGTVGHADHDAARATASALLQAGGSLNIYGRLFGLGTPIKKLETQAVGTDTQLALAVDGGAVRVLMDKFLPPPLAASRHARLERFEPGWAGGFPSEAQARVPLGPDHEL